ncbi:MAG: cache domain-containing protein [Betaproteobacteria bacterium]|nr:cache domain-containing protein [Betaproteobacteria bacterium]
MSLRIKVFLLAVLPLLLLSGVIAWVGVQMEREFSREQKRIFEGGLRASKEKELESHLKMAFSVIEPVLNNKSLSERDAQAEVKRILTHLRYGQDGYFFLYDGNGVNLVHPIQKDLVGRNLHDLQDSEGRFVIRDLLRVAQQGGGVVHYRWNKPSTGKEDEKVGYVRMLPRWGWMLGSGLYDVSAEVGKSLKQINANVQHTFRSILLVLALTILLIIALVFAINLHESRLADRHLRGLVHNFIQLQVDERRRFSRELHDGINQLMVAAKFQIDLALTQAGKGNDQYRDSLGKALGTLDTAIKEVRHISHALRPILLDEMGLEPALKNLLERFRERSGVAVQWVYELDPEPVPDDTGIMIYRVIQEGLTNIERHAGARRVSLALRQAGKAIQLALHDDGRGFEPDGFTTGRGIGLKNMRERTELLGGQFRLESSPGGGTHIYATLPMDSVSLD